MRVWLVKLEEPVPLDADFRPYRMSMIADGLIKRGHHVTRWCSDFDHLNNRPRFGRACQKKVNDFYYINFVHSSIKYDKPVSLSRLLNNYLVRRNFFNMARNEVKPDVIVCSMPTPEMARSCASLARQFNIPLILDARDMWPDVIINELSGFKLILAMPIILNMRRSLAYACKYAFSCVGITDFFRDYLLQYAKRKIGKYDAVFPLGYQDKNEIIDSGELSKIKEYWCNKGVDFDSKDKYIYFAGRLNSTVANVFSLVVDAAKILDKSRSDVKFIICGSGQFSEKIKVLSEGVTNIILPGEIKTDQLAELRKKSFIALQPIERRTDYQNSLSNKFFEYICSGLPVLTYLDGITEDVVRKYGCGYKYDTGAELAGYIEALLNDDISHNEMANNAKKLFEEQYSAKKVYQDFAIHIENVVDEVKIGSRKEYG